jgi:hypothetical protein
MVRFASPRLAVFICSHIVHLERPILLVANEGGHWMFLCGFEDHTDGDCRVVGVGHLTDRDPTINECADIPPGVEAKRKSVEHPWVRTQFR